MSTAKTSGQPRKRHARVRVSTRIDPRVLQRIERTARDRVREAKREAKLDGRTLTRVPKSATISGILAELIETAERRLAR